MLLGFKTKLKLNNKQRTILAKHSGIARHAYNWGLGLTKQILDHNQKKYEKKLAKLQWRNRNKVIASANWKKAQIKIARLHRRIANIRKDTLHKLTSYLAKNHSQIVIEDLNVSGMLKNHKLAKAIVDMGFYEFRRQLEYKCQLYGSKLIIADRWFPSSKTCSNCGWYNKDLKLSDRWFLCVECSSFLERDSNASINLANTVSHTEI